jgi:hypothetical protein
MKRSSFKRLAAMVGLSATAMVLSGCGTSGPTVGGLPPGALAPGSCARITAPIPLTGNGNYQDTYNLVAGTLPLSAGYPWGGRAQGTLYVGGSPVGGPHQTVTSQGTISLNIVPSYYGGYGTPQNQPYTYPTPPTASQYTVNIQNSYVQLSQESINQILLLIRGGMIQLPNLNPYVPLDPNQICVSAVSLNMNHSHDPMNGAERLAGDVYMYLNGSTTSGYKLHLPYGM